MKPLLTALSLVCLSTAVHAADHIGEAAYSSIINNDGVEIGNANFTQGNQGVVIQIDVEGLPAGKHGMHFHSKGTCEDHQHFKKAGGHIMPTNKPHGYFNAEGPHEGNLPNLIVHADGTANVELYTELVSVAGALGAPALLDEDGSVLMIHINEDDHLTQPIGGSGPRIACGEIKPAAKVTKTIVEKTIIE